MSTYFNKPGKQNTEETINIALKTAKEKGIKNIVVATSTGKTIDYFNDYSGINIIAVSHAYGFKEPGKNDLPDEKRKEIEAKGIKVLSTTHVLSGAERQFSKMFGGIYPTEIIANTLRLFGQGTKVAVEIAVMALDSGLIPYNEPIISIGGSSYGADTALILRPSHGSTILDTKIDEIIAKPYL